MRETKSLGLFMAFVSQNKILIENTFFVHNKLQGALYVEIQKFENEECFNQYFSF